MLPSSQISAELVAALGQAWNEGSPVAGSADKSRERIAAVALRWLASPESRAAEISQGERVHNLAKTLADRFERQPVGPLLRDYEFIAARLIDAFVTFRSAE